MNSPHGPPATDIHELNSAMEAPVLFGILIFSALIGVPILNGLRRSHRDRRKIMADGVTAQAVICKIDGNPRTDRRRVYFSFQPSAAHRAVQAKQQTTQAAIDELGLVIGSIVEVHFLPKWPKSGFVGAIVKAERAAARGSSRPPATAGLERSLALFYIAYAPSRSFRWIGSGDLVITDSMVRFTAQRRRPFWFPKTVELAVALDNIINVELLEATVRLEIREPGTNPSQLQFLTVNAQAAESIAAMLPSTKTQSFVPLLAEGAAFNQALLAVTPSTPVTPVLIAINVLMFLVVTAYGGGLFKVNSDVMIHFGTDYTPLTLSGQWWRLLTSIFLHFGLFHIALNMWALYVNGRVAERIFGSLRYLTIYLAAGLSGSVVSLLWHPIVNGAGASGAIFGIFGAMLAFFLKREGGVPPSVIKSQLTSVSIFVLYSLVNAARFRGIDNSAHLGGLVAGFILGFMLSRPLSASRNEKSWTLQWATVVSFIGIVSVSIAHLISTGAVTPGLARHGGGQSPLSELPAPTIHSLGGIALHMTSDELLRVKGVPIVQDDSEWIYNAVDAKHDGVIAVSFSGSSATKTVMAVEFTGHDKTSAPTEMPYLNSLKSAEVIQQYGRPVTSQPAAEGTTFLWFPNGVYVGTRNDLVYRYGIFDPSQLSR
jgi:membrane associated rhomboid family serine protease